MQLRDRHYAQAVVDNPWLLQIDTRGFKTLQAAKRPDGRWTLKGRIYQPGRRGRTQDEIDDDIDGGHYNHYIVAGDVLIFDDVFGAMEGKERMIRYIDLCNERPFPMEIASGMTSQLEW